MVTLTRKQLFGTAALMLPSFAVGQYFADLVWSHPYNAGAVFNGFWGVLTFTGVLALTRSK